MTNATKQKDGGPLPFGNRIETSFGKKSFPLKENGKYVQVSGVWTPLNDDIIKSVSILSHGINGKAPLHTMVTEYKDGCIVDRHGDLATLMTIGKMTQGEKDFVNMAEAQLSQSATQA